MAFGSTVPVVQGAIVTLLAARGGLSGVKVTRQMPTSPKDLRSDDGSREVIWIGGTDANGVSQDSTGSSEVNVFTAGQLIFDEEYTLNLTIRVHGSDTDDDQQTVTERAWTLYADVIGAISSTPRLGVADTSDYSLVRVRGESLDQSARSGLDPNNERIFVCQIEVGVPIAARLTLT